MARPARFGKVKAGTRPAQPVGVEAFTLSIRAVSKSFDGRCSGEKSYRKGFSTQFPCGEPREGQSPFLCLRDFVLLRCFAADSGPGGTFWQIEILLAKIGSES